MGKTGVGSLGACLSVADAAAAATVLMLLTLSVLTRRDCDMRGRIGDLGSTDIAVIHHVPNKQNQNVKYVQKHLFN
jgi:hypothetical protein